MRDPGLGTEANLEPETGFALIKGSRQRERHASFAVYEPTPGSG